MARHEDLDFAHLSVHCADCWEDEQRGRVLVEMRRSNDMKQRELQLREVGEWVEPKPAYRPRYDFLPAKPTGIGKGGVRVD